MVDWGSLVFVPEEQNVYSFWLGDKLALCRSAMYKHTCYVASDGANHYLVAPGYKHAAPAEQRHVSPVCYCSFHRVTALK
jgi:hypothetical protein